MEIVDLGPLSPAFHEQAAILLVEHFNEPRGWPTIEAAREEVCTVLETGFARALIEEQTLLGWIGGLPEYQDRVWELHPLVVHREYRRRGHGRALVAAFEAEATRRGALTFTLGTDDDSGMTSLAHADLFADLPGQIARIRDLGKGHPFLFYLSLGYAVTGVMPHANGIGLPDIYMSKASSRAAGR